MRYSTWKKITRVNWKIEAKREYITIAEMEKFLSDAYKHRHLAQSFDDREEWTHQVFAHEIRGYWEHLYLGTPNGVRHLLCNKFDDSKNVEAQKLGFVSDIGRKSNAIEQKLFKEFNGVTERQAFGYSEPMLNKCIPKQLYYINSRYINKKITCAGKADYSSHYPAHICGPLPNWDKHKRVDGTVDPTPEYPFVFYTRSGHIAEYKRFDTHSWRDENLSGDLFGNNYTPCNPDNDVSILCPESKYRLDNIIELLYTKKNSGGCIDGISAKDILVSSIGYKHLNNINNTRNRLYHLAAVCIARANQTMLDLYSQYSRSVLQIVVDGIIYMGAHEIGSHEKSLGRLHQEITDQSFIMRGINQYMFFDRATQQCTISAHSGFDQIHTDKLEDIWLWRKSQKE